MNTESKKPKISQESFGLHNNNHIIILIWHEFEMFIFIVSVKGKACLSDIVSFFLINSE